MEVTIKKEIPEDFKILCDIFQVKPEGIIESIVDRISFPYFFSHINGRERWATLLFLEHLDASENEAPEKEMELHEIYGDKIMDAIQKHLQNDDGVSATLKAENAARILMREWHKEVMKERAKYLLDNLPEQE